MTRAFLVDKLFRPQVKPEGHKHFWDTQDCLVIVTADRSEWRIKCFHPTCKTWLSLRGQTK